MRPREHPGGLVLVEQLQTHEQPEHGAAECLGQPAVSCAGHDTNVPSGRNPPSVTRRCTCGCQFARAVRLQAGDNPHREVALTRERADGGGDGACGDTGDLAEQAATVEAIGAQRQVGQK